MQGRNRAARPFRAAGRSIRLKETREPVRPPGLGRRKAQGQPVDHGGGVGAANAIGDADQIVIGPGSLYTSVLAAMAVPDITKAVSKSGARRIYVANLRPQRAETTGYDVSRHLAALMDHGVVVDTVLCDTSGITLGDTEAFGPDFVLAELAKANGLAHDPGKLAGALAGLVG